MQPKALRRLQLRRVERSAHLRKQVILQRDAAASHQIVVAAGQEGCEANGALKMSVRFLEAAVLGEEMGFVGFSVLLMVFGFLVFRGFQIALLLKRRRERALALSFSLLIIFSVFINVGMALGLLPTKGLTLPLISYGGSSLICTGLMIGWLLSLEREAEQPVPFREKEIEE